MRVNIDIKEDEQFRKHVKEMLSGEIRGILRAELSGIVTAEIAKLRLLQPGSTTLSDLVTKHVQHAINQQVHRISDATQKQITRHVKTAIEELIPDLQDNIRSELKKAIGNL